MGEDQCWTQTKGPIFQGKNVSVQKKPWTKEAAREGETAERSHNAVLKRDCRVRRFGGWSGRKKKKTGSTEQKQKRVGFVKQESLRHPDEKKSPVGSHPIPRKKKR